MDMDTVSLVRCARDRVATLQIFPNCVPTHSVGCRHDVRNQTPVKHLRHPWDAPTASGRKKGNGREVIARRGGCVPQTVGRNPAASYQRPPNQRPTRSWQSDGELCADPARLCLLVSARSVGLLLRFAPTTTRRICEHPSRSSLSRGLLLVHVAPYPPPRRSSFRARCNGRLIQHVATFGNAITYGAVARAVKGRTPIVLLNTHPDLP